MSLPENLHQLLQQFSVTQSTGLPLEENELFEELKRRLAIPIQKLIERDMERLFHILYRLDVAPQKVDECFNLAIPKEIALALADAILKREWQKKLTQEYFRKNH
jgi:hypothetical protein